MSKSVNALMLNKRLEILRIFDGVFVHRFEDDNFAEQMTTESLIYVIHGHELRNCIWFCISNRMKLTYRKRTYLFKEETFE